MKAFSTSRAARASGLTTRQVRAAARTGLVRPTRNAGGRLEFGFQDLVVLRLHGRLEAGHPGRARQALVQVRRRLPSATPLSALCLEWRRDRLVVVEEVGVWEADSGQLLLDLDGLPPARAGAGMEAAVRAERRERARASFQEGLDLEASEAGAAAVAYERAVALDPGLADAHANLGRLRHEAGDLMGAESCYRRAVEQDPEHATALFNLAVALQDQGRGPEAREAYERVLAMEPQRAAAHYNLARILEGAGDRAGAFRHLLAYRRLTGPGIEGP